MNQHQDRARKANRAVSAIADTMVKTLTDMRPSVSARYDLDDQLVTLAIAKAAVNVAADAASQATGMKADEHHQLEVRLHDVVFDAMNQLLNK